MVLKATPIGGREIEGHINEVNLEGKNIAGIEFNAVRSTVSSHRPFKITKLYLREFGLCREPWYHMIRTDL